MGKPNSVYKKLFSTAKKMYDTIVKELYPGNNVRNILKTQKILDKEGLTKIAPFAHGLGMEAPEEPMIGSDKWPLDPIDLKLGMCFSVEPNPVTKDKKMGIFLGDTFVVTKKGCECLNKFPPELSIV